MLVFGLIASAFAQTCDSNNRTDCGYSGINELLDSYFTISECSLVLNGLGLFSYNRFYRCYFSSGPSPGCATNPPCSGHGSCPNSNCVCTAPYITCGSSSINDCAINPTTDASNCGGCGNVCASGAGVKSSICSVGSCVVTCQAGYLLCFGQCVYGATTCTKPPLANCDIFDENQCAGDVIVTDPSFENHRWFTPLKGQTGYQPSFQDYGKLVAHAHVEYSSDLKTATVQLIALHRDPNVTFKYLFDGVAQPSSNKTFFAASTTSFVTLQVMGSDSSAVTLQELDFPWLMPVVTPANPNGDYRGGQKGAIVEMFGWPHADVAQECAFLAQAGYLGVKLFPPQEQVMSAMPFNNILNPWYFMYQPVSYRLSGRMGSKAQLRKTISQCRALGVRVYADAVINHMVGSGNDANPQHRNQNGGTCTTWLNKSSSALYNGDAMGMSSFYSQGFVYTYGPNTDQPPSQEFPAVPYGPLDFHCERVLNSWNDPLDLNAGWLTGLVDLNTERENVQERIADYLTDLIALGFSGFRVDAAKHIQPDDLVAIFSKLRRNLGGSLPADFITWWEVLLGGETQMLICDESSGYNYGPYLVTAFQNAGFSEQDILKIKIWNSGYPKEPSLCGVVDLRRSAVQNDDADQQTPGSSSRDMQGYGCVLIKDCSSVDAHRQFEVQLFQNPNGVGDNDNNFPIRLVLSSYYWDSATGSMGIPDGLSNCSLCTDGCTGCQDMYSAPAFKASSKGYDGPQDYTRPHRDSAIISAMKSWMHM